MEFLAQIVLLGLLLLVALIARTVVMTMRMDVVPGGSMAVLDQPGDDPAPAGVRELEAPTIAAFTNAGLRAEHGRIRYGAGGGAPDLWMQSWVSPGEPLRALSITAVDLGPKRLNQHTITLWTDVEGPGEIEALVTTNLPFATGDEDSGLADGMRLPGGDPGMIVRLHRARIAEHVPRPSVDRQRDAERQITETDRRGVERQVARGRARVVGPNVYRRTFRGALRAVTVQLPPWRGRLDRQERARAEALMARLPPQPD